MVAGLSPLLDRRQTACVPRQRDTTTEVAEIDSAAGTTSAGLRGVLPTSLRLRVPFVSFAFPVPLSDVENEVERAVGAVAGVLRRHHQLAPEDAVAGVRRLIGEV